VVDNDDKNNLLQQTQRHQTMQKEHVSKCIKPLQGTSKEIVSFTKRAEYILDDITLKTLLPLQRVVQYFSLLSPLTPWVS